LEVKVYDSLNRKVLITVALTAGVLAAFTMFLLLPHQGTRVPTTGATIRIERPSGKVFQLDFYSASKRGGSASTCLSSTASA
jgi:hypothetical protein